jgi:HTH-type transcriptional regulator, global nitrogen regulator NrpRI
VDGIRQRRERLLLTLLKDANRPLPSGELARAIVLRGEDISERTVRLYLKGLDEQGFTLNHGKRGREISKTGLAELVSSDALARVGFLSAKIDQMTYRMNFDLALRTGLVVVNTTLVAREQLEANLDDVCLVFERGMAMGRLVGLLPEGERIGETTVPKGKVGLCTVCSITLNGVLLKHGIPCSSRFGGLMEVRDGQATRYLEIINYDGTSIDPLEVFFRSGMTDYLGAIHTGNGRIGASFREIPGDSRDLALELARKLDAVGLGGFMEIGQSGQSLFDIPVSEGRAGAAVIGGLNPTAIFEEKGIRLQSHALSGLLEYNRLFRYEELGDQLAALAP